MVDVRDKERSSWSVLTPSATQQQQQQQQQHYSNLERFLQCATPSPPSKFLPQSCIHDLNSLWQPPGSKDIVEYFTLGDLWGCYDEWSAYGAGTQVVLSCGETIMQYYVPYLSAIQIYSNKSVVASRFCNLFSTKILLIAGGTPLSLMICSREVELPCFSSCRNSRQYNDVVQFESDCWSDDSMSDHKLSRSLSNNSSKTWDTISEDSSVDHEGSLSMRDKLGYLHFQYFEISSPYWRVPLMEKVTELARNNPGLITLKNVDLSPASWMAVAWYPIYHIPSQGNDKDLSTCFLTYHTLSSSFQDCVNGDDDIEANGTGSKRKGEGIGDISLPPFGLATYKMQGDLWINPETSDDERMIYLESAAGSWLKQLNVHHHDYNFFTSCHCTM